MKKHYKTALPDSETIPFYIVFDYGQLKTLFGRKFVLQEGLKEGINLDPVGVFEPHYIQKPLLDVPANGASGNVKHFRRFRDGQAIGNFLSGMVCTPFSDVVMLPLHPSSVKVPSYKKMQEKTGDFLALSKPMIIRIQKKPKGRLPTLPGSARVPLHSLPRCGKLNELQRHKGRKDSSEGNEATRPAAQPILTKSGSRKEKGDNSGRSDDIGYRGNEVNGGVLVCLNFTVF